MFLSVNSGKRWVLFLGFQSVTHSLSWQESGFISIFIHSHTHFSTSIFFLLLFVSKLCTRLWRYSGKKKKNQSKRSFLILLAVQAATRCFLRLVGREQTVWWPEWPTIPVFLGLKGLLEGLSLWKLENRDCKQGLQTGTDANWLLGLEFPFAKREWYRR